MIRKLKNLSLVIANVFGSSVPIGRGAGLDCNFDELISVDCDLRVGFKLNIGQTLERCNVMLNNAKLSIVVEDDTKAACLLTSGVSEFAVLDNDCYTGRLEDGYQARISVYMTDRKISTGGVYQCQLPTEVPVDSLEIDITKPGYQGEDKTYDGGSIPLKTIIDGSTTKELEFGSEVLVYADLGVPTGFKVELTSCNIRFTDVSCTYLRAINPCPPSSLASAVVSLEKSCWSEIGTTKLEEQTNRLSGSFGLVALRSVRIEGCMATIVHECESGWTKQQYGDEQVCFKNFEQVKPSDSLETCSSVGATHVLPANEAENSGLLAFMDSVEDVTYGTETIEFAWLNLNDAAEEGVWVGNDGEPTTPWRNWVDDAPGHWKKRLELNEGEHDYAWIDNRPTSENRGKWDDAPNVHENVICYKPLVASRLSWNKK